MKLDFPGMPRVGVNGLFTQAALRAHHSAHLMNLIVDLGGEPGTTPNQFDLPADPRGMITCNMKMEAEDVANHLPHAQLVDELELPELTMKLEKMAAEKATC